MAAQVQTPFNDGHILYDELHQMYPEVAENDIMRLMTEVCSVILQLFFNYSLMLRDQYDCKKKFAAIRGPDFRASIIILTHMFKQINKLGLL